MSQNLKMYSVLFFSSATHVQGGAVQSMYRNARWLKRAGGKPLVVLPRDGEIIDWYKREGIKVLVVPFIEMHRSNSLFYLLRYLFSTIWIILRLAILIRKHSVDIVHVNEITYWPGLVAGKIANANTICHVRVILTRPKWVKYVLTRMAYLFSDRILCVSNAVHDEMFDSMNQKIQRLYNPGPDRDHFNPHSVGDGLKVRRELGINNDVFVVGLVSKFIRNKGHLALIEAAHKIKSEFQIVDIVYVLVGGTIKGHEEYFAEVCNRISRYGLDEYYIFTGVRDDVPRLISACDVMVHLPIHEDPFPGVVLEALAMEKPFIGFDSGGVSEQFKDRESGFLLEKKDIDELVKVLIELKDEPYLRQKIGREGKNFLDSHFNFEKFFSELGKIYLNLV